MRAPVRAGGAGADTEPGHKALTDEAADSFEVFQVGSGLFYLVLSYFDSYRIITLSSSLIYYFWPAGGGERRGLMVQCWCTGSTQRAPGGLLS
jgi:hypothetical protein